MVAYWGNPVKEDALRCSLELGNVSSEGAKREKVGEEEVCVYFKQS